MKKILLVTLISFFAINAHGEINIIGGWKDKSDPPKNIFVFKENHDFEHIQRTHWDVDKSGNFTKRDKSSIGVWELGSWTITYSKDVKYSCNLMIYQDKTECCFEAKIITNNLILNSKYDENKVHGICENKVLVREQ